MGSDLVYSILSPGMCCKTQVSRRFVIGLQSHACPRIDLRKVGVWAEVTTHGGRLIWS
jgi:hypothetical protein